MVVRVYIHTCMYSTCPATDKGTPNQPKFFNFPKRILLGHNILHATRVVLSLYKACTYKLVANHIQFMVKIKIFWFLLFKMYFGLKFKLVI